MGDKPLPVHNIEKYLAINLKMLSCIGLKISLDDSKAIVKRGILIKIPIFMTIALGMLAASSQIRLIIHSLTNNNMLMATHACSHLFTNMLCMNKGYQMSMTVAKLEEIVREINDIWKQNSSKDIFQEKIVTGAASTLRFCKVFVIATFSTICSSGIPPIVKFMIRHVVQRSSNETYDYATRIFIIDYPFPVDDSVTYFCVLSEEVMLLLASGMYWVCCDTLFAQLTSHLSLQFQVLRHDIEALINEETVDYNLKNKIALLIQRHQKLLSICNLIEHVFSPIILATVLLSAMNLCMNIFELNKTIADKNYTDAPLHAFIFTNTFLQIVFYCTFAEKLTAQTSLVANAVYNCMWTEQDSKFRVFLQIIIMRSQSPFYCTAYGLLPLGHERLTIVIKAAFSYYMILQTLKYR